MMKDLSLEHTNDDVLIAELRRRAETSPDFLEQAKAVLVGDQLRPDIDQTLKGVPKGVSDWIKNPTSPPTELPKEVLYWLADKYPNIQAVRRLCEETTAGNPSAIHYYENPEEIWSTLYILSKYNDRPSFNRMVRLAAQKELLRNVR